MKVVALVSGGKDSCFAMMRCLDYGHEIVALANLLPLDDSVDELDSFMYQTVGHQIVVAFSQCMGLPLFRRRIQGRARARDLRYALTDGDEVEDLFLLLKEVQKSFPTLGGVSCGAIASDYQRMRVENVCSRLGLVSLAFLWKQEQASLLQQMIASRIHAVLVKVAAIGLNPHKHLGKDLAALQPYLDHLKNLYGINVCGEGGEYETLTLDCPLFKNFKIVLDEFTIILHSPDTIAPVGVLHPSKFHLEPKSLDSPPALTPAVPWVQEVVGSIQEENLTHQQGKDLGVAMPNVQQFSIDESEYDLHITCMKRHHNFSIISCWSESHDTVNGIEYELGRALTSIHAELLKDNLSWEDVLYIHLYLDDMGSFTLANHTYMQHITERLCIRGVPSRSTVELPLTKSYLGRVMVEAIAARDKDKKVLHVQSISCWAPSCIGPYSQATLHKGMLYMAGQLGLDPPTMALVSGGAASEMEQALRNCEAVAQAYSTSVIQSAISILIYCSSLGNLPERKQIETVLNKFLAFSGQGDGGAADIAKLPILYVQVPALPKGALLEVEPFLHVPFPDEGRNQELKRVLTWESRPGCLSDEACQWDLSACEGSIVPGQCCRAFLCVRLRSKSQSFAKDSSCFPLHTVSPESDVECKLGGLKVVFKSCLQAFSKMLEEASLCWEDVMAFRVLFVAEVVSLGSLVEAFKEILSESCVSTSCSTREEQLLFNKASGLSFLQPLFIPVLGIGQNSSMLDLITIDLLALGA